jgi:hypothetical protein
MYSTDTYIYTYTEVLRLTYFFSFDNVALQIFHLWPLGRFLAGVQLTDREKIPQNYRMFGSWILISV